MAGSRMGFQLKASRGFLPGSPCGRYQHGAVIGGQLQVGGEGGRVGHVFVDQPVAQLPSFRHWVTLATTLRRSARLRVSIWLPGVSASARSSGHRGMQFFRAIRWVGWSGVVRSITRMSKGWSLSCCWSRAARVRLFLPLSGARQVHQQVDVSTAQGAVGAGAEEAHPGVGADHLVGSLADGLTGGGGEAQDPTVGQRSKPPLSRGYPPCVPPPPAAAARRWCRRCGGVGGGRSRRNRGRGWWLRRLAR